MSSQVCSHVKVVVRVRPENDNEKRENLRNVIQVVDHHMLIFDPKEEEDIVCFGAKRVRNRDLNKRANKDLKFVFDHVFGEDSVQVDVFENTTKTVLDGVLAGFNCTVFAYGATGAGKTHTMLGSPDEPGVMYRTMKELFTRMEALKDEKDFDISFSYLEVYNEQIRDLLANVGPLAVREDMSKGVVVTGLTLHRPKSADHILEALEYGNQNRTQHPTDMNANSSRSHAVFQIYLKQKDRTASLNPNACVAKMSLIDLAGSERASATNAKGARFREGANINKSLLALGNVINALADPKRKKSAHIPYRDSKLTRLLKDSLGGNCRTVMIANVSPSSLSFDDTLNTLKYANRAKEIKTSLKSNVVTLDSHIGQYALICEKQRQEIAELKQKLKAYEDNKKEISMPGVSNAIASQKQAEFQKVSESLQTIFSSRTQIRSEQLDLERQLKENELRQRHGEENNLQIQLFCGSEKTEKATCKHERRMAALLTKRQHICKRMEEAERRFLENDGCLHRVENEMKLLGPGAQPPEVLKKDLHIHRLQLQVNDLKKHIEQMIQLTVLQDRENKRVQKMVNIMLPTYSRQYGTLHGAALLTPADELENREIQQLVLKERGVVWADQNTSGGGGAELQSMEETAEAAPGQSTFCPDLAPILAFSHLQYHQNSPCSAERCHNKRISLRNAPASKGDDTVAMMNGDTPAKKPPIRRNLAVSMPTLSPKTIGFARSQGMAPLQCTPEPVEQQQYASSAAAPPPPQPHPPVTIDPNMTFEICESDGPIANSTIIVETGSFCEASTSAAAAPPVHDQPLKPAAAGANIWKQQPAKREPIPALSDVMRRSKPPYMALTSAASVKRKLPRGSAEEGKQELSAPKRVKVDPPVTSRPLKVRRFGASAENQPARRVVRSVSEGNLSRLEPQKSSKSIFYKTFKSVTRRM